MNCECDRCGQTALTECVINEDGFCACCIEEMEKARQSWEAKIESMPDPPDIEEAIERAAKELSDAIDAEILKKFGTEVGAVTTFGPNGNHKEEE